MKRKVLLCWVYAAVAGCGTDDSGELEHRPVCGNAILESPEQCDDGSMNSNSVADACRLDCRSPRCGDGVEDTGEACDDGNPDNRDGCSVDCAVEATAGDLIVTYELWDTGADRALSCSEAGVSWVDIYVVEPSSGNLITQVQDSTCDDSAIKVPDLAFGTYRVSLVAWDLTIWDGLAEDVAHAAVGARVTVRLKHVL